MTFKCNIHYLRLIVALAVLVSFGLFSSAGIADAAEGIALFKEAINKVRETCLYPSPPPPRIAHADVRDTLRRYIRGIDAYSDYLTPVEYDAFLQNQNKHYSGVGMQIIEHRGRIICVPFPGGPAERAGIKAGDVLVAVNGENVANMSIVTIGSKARGPAGSRVRLSYRSSFAGPVRRVGLVRELTEPRTVHISEEGNGPQIKILRFTSSTPVELKQALKAFVHHKKPIFLNLRDNIGGNLGAAVEAAGLFLKTGSTVVTVKTVHRSTRYTARDGSFAAGPALILLQNQFTASAAEVFIAALTQNDRAVSFGPTSFGKGVSQEIVELSDGSAMFITHAELLPPDGRPYHGVGIKATYKGR